MCPDEMFCAGLKEFSCASPASLSALSLAFIGDAVYEVMVRSYILSMGDARVQTLHSRAIELVNASFQAKAAEMLLPFLEEDETAVYKRGRNAPSAHTPKNKTEAEYHKATGFEALVGYLWLSRRFDRLNNFFRMITSDVFENEREC